MMGERRPDTGATRWDPRYWQIGALSALLLYGVARLDFDITASRAAAILGSALALQWICSRLWRLPKFDPRSAAISGLSLCLLLRTNDLRWALAASALAIVPKFVVRWRGKHLFNPTNLAIVALLIITPDAWVSPAQWGSAAFFGFFVACIGGLVVNRAARWDVTVAFLAFWCAILFGRSLRLHEPMTIPLHRLESGSLLIFAFFMISDPRTTPDSRIGRLLFAALAAIGAWYIQFKLFRTNGLLWSLAGVSMLTPLIDWILPGKRYDWSAPSPDPRREREKEANDETEMGAMGGAAASGALR